MEKRLAVPPDDLKEVFDLRKMRCIIGALVIWLSFTCFKPAVITHKFHAPKEMTSESADSKKIMIVRIKRVTSDVRKSCYASVNTNIWAGQTWKVSKMSLKVVDICNVSNFTLN